MCTAPPYNPAPPLVPEPGATVAARASRSASRTRASASTPKDSTANEAAATPADEGDPVVRFAAPAAAREAGDECPTQGVTGAGRIHGRRRVRRHRERPARRDERCAARAALHDDRGRAAREHRRRAVGEIARTADEAELVLVHGDDRDPRQDPLEIPPLAEDPFLHRVEEHDRRVQLIQLIERRGLDRRIGVREEDVRGIPSRRGDRWTPAADRTEIRVPDHAQREVVAVRAGPAKGPASAPFDPAHIDRRGTEDREVVLAQIGAAHRDEHRGRVLRGRDARVRRRPAEHA